MPAGTVNAAPSTLSFGGSERSIPKSTFLSVDTLDLVTGEIVQSIVSKPRSKVAVDCSTRFCISVVRGSAVVRKKGRRTVQEYFGLSKGFGEVVKTAKARRVKLSTKVVRQLKASRSAVPIRSVAAAAPLRVGVPGKAFTINQELADLIGAASNVASPIITTLAQSPCYRGEDAFSVVEVDPRVLRERKKEFDLIKKGFVKAEPGFTDQYQPPNATVRGSVSLNGASATASIELVSSSGQVIASATGSNSAGDWVEAVDQATRDVAGALCPGPRISISFARCTLRECSCGSNSDGYRIEISAEGIAKLPVGALMFLTIPDSPSPTHNCGGAQPSKFGDALACSRPSASIVENFSFMLGNVDPAAPSCSCPREGFPQSILLVGTAIDLTTGQRDDAIVPDVLCRVAS
jgi:hypothetical protein